MKSKFVEMNINLYSLKIHSQYKKEQNIILNNYYSTRATVSAQYLLHSISATVSALRGIIFYGPH